MIRRPLKTVDKWMALSKSKSIEKLTIQQLSKSYHLERSLNRIKLGNSVTLLGSHRNPDHSKSMLMQADVNK